jgi:hypothetical protein
VVEKGEKGGKFNRAKTHHGMPMATGCDMSPESGNIPPDPIAMLVAEPLFDSPEHCYMNLRLKCLGIGT